MIVQEYKYIQNLITINNPKFIVKFLDSIDNESQILFTSIFNGLLMYGNNMWFLIKKEAVNERQCAFLQLRFSLGCCQFSHLTLPLGFDLGVFLYQPGLFHQGNYSSRFVQSGWVPWCVPVQTMTFLYWLGQPMVSSEQYGRTPWCLSVPSGTFLLRQPAQSGWTLWCLQVLTGTFLHCLGHYPYLSHSLVGSANIWDH